MVRKCAENDGTADDESGASAPIADPWKRVAQSVKFMLSNVGRMPKSKTPSYTASDAPDAAPHETTEVMFKT
jgi:hypothetical protein